MPQGEKTKRALKADLRNRLREEEKVQKIRHEFTRERERERVRLLSSARPAKGLHATRGKKKRALKADLRNRLREEEKVQKIRHEFTRERRRERES
jgi:enoyl-CoA hydratase/carnithine racemase